MSIQTHLLPHTLRLLITFFLQLTANMACHTTQSLAQVPINDYLSARATKIRLTIQDFATFAKWLAYLPSAHTLTIKQLMQVELPVHLCSSILDFLPELEGMLGR